MAISHGIIADHGKAASSWFQGQQYSGLKTVRVLIFIDQHVTKAAIVVAADSGHSAQQANCFGVLDVHDGQFVWIAYGLGSPAERPVTPQEQLCNTVPMIAASAVAALG